MTVPPQIALTMSEAGFQSVVMDYAVLLGWMCCHYRPATVVRKDGRVKWATHLSGHPGAPDLILAKAGRVLLVELKRHGKHPEPAQRLWLAALGQYGVVWTPMQWNDGTITAVLTT